MIDILKFIDKRQICCISAEVASLIGAGIAAAGNVGSQVVGSAKNMRIARYQYEKNIENRDYMNQYNSPAAQLHRYQEAGLNPNLIYGDSGSAVKSEGAHFDAPYIQAPDLSPLGNVFEKAASLALQRKELEKKDEEINNLRLTGHLIDSQATREDLNNLAQSTLLGVNVGVWQPEEREAVKNSTFGQSHAAELIALDDLHELRKQQKKLNNLSIEERNYFIKNLMPLQEEYYKLRNEGLSFENTIKEIESTVADDLGKFGSSYSREGIKIIVDIIKYLIFAKNKK